MSSGQRSSTDDRVETPHTYYTCSLSYQFIIMYLRDHIQKEDPIDRNLTANWTIMTFEVSSPFTFKIFGPISYY